MATRVHRYESRITIVDAFQYRGQVGGAPDWIDRNWVAYADHDPIRGIEPGPALLVPTYRGDQSYCRVGDYIARQSVLLAHGVEPEVRLEVWPKEQFERIFIPSAGETGSSLTSGQLDRPDDGTETADLVKALA